MLPPGLSPLEAAQRLNRDGPNTMPEPRRAGLPVMVVRQLTHLLAALLWAAALLAAVAGQPSLAVAIVIVIVLNAVFAVAQEYRADRSTQELRSLLPTTCRVRRGGRTVSIEAADLVVGDLVLLEHGDRISADLVVTVAHELRVDESLLTGESVPVPHVASERLLAGTYWWSGRPPARSPPRGPGRRSPTSPTWPPRRPGRGAR